ncbi:MAG: phosphate ABC transporter ATP-binding protein [Bacteroidota bacterium]
MESKISIQNLNLSIGKNSILKNINLDIPKNQVTVILGPSGCGKTTLLKCLNRLIDLEENVKISGNIFLDNEDILHTKSDLPGIRKKMGLLSQRPYPLPMNIFDNIAYGMRINGNHNKQSIRLSVEHHLKQVSLWEEVKSRLKEPASRLSIGQQQRLCLARGLAVEPEIILADEPTSALDPHSSTAIEKKFIELKADYTVVMVTHILRQARRIADYVVFMYLGEIVEQGSADHFFNHPQQQQTKAYLQGVFN